jgi:hypothetical protein
LAPPVIIKEFEVQFDVWQGASQYGNGRRNLIEVHGGIRAIPNNKAHFSPLQ